MHDTARALKEIGEFILALDLAKPAVDLDRGPQSRAAADYWCALVEVYRPGDLVDARMLLFRRWPFASTATRLHHGAREAWPQYKAEVMTALQSNPADAVTFTLTTPRNPAREWHLAHEIALNRDPTWSALVKSYEKIDPVAAMPVHP